MNLTSAAIEIWSVIVKFQCILILLQVNAFSYATPEFCYNNPQSIVTLDYERSDHSVLTPKRPCRAFLNFLHEAQILSAIGVKEFSFEEAGKFCNAELFPQRFG